jgi:CelD/BcsL family acetyltransferase involved in cellulose biosynthesis
LTGITWRWETDLDSLGANGEHLVALVNGVAAATVFNTWEWTVAAANHLHRGSRRLIMLTGWRGADLVCCVPATAGVERLHGLRVSSLRLIGDPLADRSPLLYREDEEGIVENIVAHLERCPVAWDVLILSELPENDDQFRYLLARLLAGQRKIFSRLCASTPVLILDGFDRKQIVAGYSKSLALRQKRARKKLADAGNVRFQRMLPGVDTVNKLLDRLMKIEDASWKGKIGVGIFSSAERRTFFTDLSTRLAKRRWLDVSILWLDECAISYRFGFRFRGVFYDYNLAYLPEYARLSPGRILLEEILLSSTDEGLRAVDASRASLKNGHLLQDWTELRQDHYQVWVFSVSWRGRFLQAMKSTVNPRVRRLFDFLRNE